MITDDDGLAPVRKTGARVHEIGQPIEDLSIEEIALRIDVLRSEIERLDQMRQSKEASRAGAEALFKF
ncbi:MAG: DUF1192 domain-containing protein [Methylovirgula sp.]